MKHSEAPFRLYKSPDGRVKVWDETGELGRYPSSVELDAPPPSWKLLRGFRTAKSFWDYMKNVGKRMT